MNCECVVCKNNKPFELSEEIIEAALEENLVLFCDTGIGTEEKTVALDLCAAFIYRH